jgi:hypothetical protein
MNNRTLLSAAALLTAMLLLPGCGGEDGGPVPSNQAQSQPQTLDTAQLLAVAQVASEVTDPATVDHGALVLADENDETSDPMPVS